ncbi:MAG: flagellar basal body-associated FliL family protein [Rickettsiales bacterium]
MVDDEEEKIEDAGDGETQEDGEGKPQKKSKKKKLIILLVVLLLLAGGGGGAFMMLSGDSGHSDDDEVVELDEHGNPVVKTVYYTVPQFIVNLNSSRKSSQFLKTTIILEVPKEEDINYIESNLPRVVDVINTYLRELRASDLAGTAGIQRLREEILLRVNKALAPIEINNVLFKEIIVQ